MSPHPKANLKSIDKFPVIDIDKNKKNLQFTKGDIARAIPKHCFKRSYMRSLGYLFGDLITLGLTLAAYILIDQKLNLPWWLDILVFLAYTAYQGINFTGLWVICHECGHGGFSDSAVLNDTIGSIFHTMLCVPYFAWQFSHAKHHARCNHMTEDEPYIPVEAPQDPKSVQTLKPTASNFATALRSFAVLVLGWPLYLTFNLSGPGPVKGEYHSHFYPHTSLWKTVAPWKMYLNNIMLISWQIFLVSLAMQYGWSPVLRYYWAPQLICNGFLTSITYLQHTDPRIAHFKPQQWTWMRGALATVDRSMGPWLDARLHHIVDTHVAHHIFSDLPFYHCHEATKHFLPVLGKYYCKIDSNFAVDFWTNIKHCNYVNGANGILHFVVDNF